jgi:hypothetical protein
VPLSARLKWLLLATLLSLILWGGLITGGIMLAGNFGPHLDPATTAGIK